MSEVSRPTVLIVDDNDVTRALLRGILRLEGYEISGEAKDGEQALTMALEQKPAAICLDVVMPKQDGFATCRALKKEATTAEIPVVLITSKGAETDKFWGKRQGAAAYLVKPYGPEALRTVITDLV